MRDPVSAVDQIITEAQNEGKFADLRGKGEPLVIDTSPDAVIKGILKEARRLPHARVDHPGGRDRPPARARTAASSELCGSRGGRAGGAVG